MKKNKKVALYNPYLDILGGGEKHILSIIKVFDELGYRTSIFWDKNLESEIKKRLSLQFINKLEFLPNIFKDRCLGLSTLKTLRILKTFDYFFYVTDGSYFFTSAIYNYIFVMVPNKRLYQMNFLNKLKTKNFQFISNSPYTQKKLKKWRINSTPIPPYVDAELIDSKTDGSKEKVILTVGRFFAHLHSKRQDIAIQSFKKLKQKNPLFKDFKLILAGGLKEEDNEYFNQLKKLAGYDSNIIFKPNISLDELYKLYKVATYFWHFAGYKINEDRFPDRVEHFGLAPLEAMAAGCLTFAVAAGGPKETVKDGKNGFLFNTQEELIRKMTELNNNLGLQNKIRQNGKNYVKDNFSYNIFKEKVKRLI